MTVGYISPGYVAVVCKKGSKLLTDPVSSTLLAQTTGSLELSNSGRLENNSLISLDTPSDTQETELYELHGRDVTNLHNLHVFADSINFGAVSW